MSKYDQDRAELPLRDVGTGTGDLTGHGVDLGVDAVNSLGSITGDTQSIAAGENCACATPAPGVSGGNSPDDSLNGSMGGLGG